MDFFERQAQAHRHTKWLVAYFVVGVALLIVAVYAATLLVSTSVLLGSVRHTRLFLDNDPLALWRPNQFIGAAMGTVLVVGLGSLFKISELSRGGSVVASMLGGRLVNPASTDPLERKLLNVVEEMAIASGVPVPQVYVLPNEQGINAFAAGHSTSDAVVAVTAGALKLLTRDELQGVIAHEFSHILNGDMRLNLRLMGTIFGILCIATIGRVLLQTQGRSRNGRDRAGAAMLGLAFLAIGWIGVFFGRMIQAAVSREREFLADASAVQFTRNPLGLSSALKKIGCYGFGSRLLSPQAEQASHLFFSNGMEPPLMRVMATHPPIAERIRALDPGWDGKFPPLAEEQIEVVKQAALAEMEHARNRASGRGAVLGDDAFAALSGLGPVESGPRNLPPSPPRIPPPPQIVAARRALAATGTPNTAHLQYAADVRAAIPQDLRNSARSGLGASAIVYALLFSDDPSVRRRQLEALAGLTSPAVAQETVRLLPQLRTIAVRAKLPLVDLAVPGLREMSPEQYTQFRAAVQSLVECDGQIDLFEYVLQKIVLRHIAPVFGALRHQVIQYYAFKPLAEDCEALLSALAYVGQEGPDQVRDAFQQGAQLLGYHAQTELKLLPRDRCQLAQVDAALNHLAQAAPQVKKNLLDACAETVAADGVIQELEAEMLRAIADSLDCPLPPLLG